MLAAAMFIAAASIWFAPRPRRAMDPGAATAH
jgi:hypothetical protein